MTARERFTAACVDITNDSLAVLALETGLRYLGSAGPLYLMGSVRARGTFVGPDGRYWADGNLVAESLTAGTGRTYDDCEYWAERACGGIEGHGLWVATVERGLHDATLSPLPQIAQQLELPAPEPFPDGWARSWSDFPWISDERELGLIAHGHPGSANWRNGGQL
ncbi:hypothetical protein [Streptomyces sp. PH10-H1]|uniref:hypothetical protein n=1 Tax=Streptomyces sp. PH10-H1 TaxID=3046212 RepID=UPI0024BAA0A9|nr:hypothetical protein [Streptomyces sp. PH10-H1]MDJ0341774.1 hypothetical protein [Streptomyces sp. PH10-H1]